MSLQPARLSPEELAEQKRVMYANLSPRRRRFIDKIGYDKWDPFPVPFDPIDIRTEESGRTLQDLVRTFVRMRSQHMKVSPAYSKGAHEFALGIMKKDERIQGMYEFALWYAELLEKEGKDLSWEIKA